jgi:hypothetical protein
MDAIAEDEPEFCGCGACSEERPMDATAAGTPRLSDQVFEFRVGSRQKKFPCRLISARVHFSQPIISNTPPHTSVV